MKKTLIASVLLGLFTSTASIASEETQELREIIKEQQKTLEALERRLDESELKIEATVEQVESSSYDNALSNISIGGYGELLYNNFEDEAAEIDFQRFVLFLGYEYSDNIRFFSEIELEHSVVGDDETGELELEQAYIEIDVNDKLTTKLGLFLVPVGIINETHEPTTFYGVERNRVENAIIPTTWREAGVAINYKLSEGLSFDAVVSSGLEISDSVSIRSARQSVSQASAENLAYTGRLKYTGINGLELATTLQYQTDISQSSATLDTAEATLIEAHAIYQVNDFSIRALYARWDINGDEAKALGRDEQTGFYIEPSYKVTKNTGVFARYSEFDNEDGNSASTKTQTATFGVNYYLHEGIVLKADYQNVTGATDTTGFNLGLGYEF